MGGGGGGDKSERKRRIRNYLYAYNKNANDKNMTNKKKKSTKSTNIWNTLQVKNHTAKTNENKTTKNTSSNQDKTTYLMNKMYTEVHSEQKKGSMYKSNCNITTRNISETKIQRDDNHHHALFQRWIQASWSGSTHTHIHISSTITDFCSQNCSEYKEKKQTTETHPKIILRHERNVNNRNMSLNNYKTREPWTTQTHPKSPL